MARPRTSHASDIYYLDHILCIKKKLKRTFYYKGGNLGDIVDIRLWQGDCLDLMKNIEDKSIDMVLCDLPYGTTQCKWDTVIPFDLLWKQYNRIIKNSGAIVLFGGQPFTSALIMSNPKMFKYCWVWKKERASNFFAAKFQPLNNTEDIIVFSHGGCNTGTKNPVCYFPQGTSKIDKIMKNSKTTGGKIGEAHKIAMKPGVIYKQETTGYPYKLLEFSKDKEHLHPTQKPVLLLEYLIKTYTNENETVLDNCMGSGSTGVACKNLNRKFIGIELDEGYFKIAESRMAV